MSGKMEIKGANWEPPLGTTWSHWWMMTRNKLHRLLTRSRCLENLSLKHPFFFFCFPRLKHPPLFWSMDDEKNSRLFWFKVFSIKTSNCRLCSQNARSNILWRSIYIAIWDEWCTLESTRDRHPTYLRTSLYKKERNLDWNIMSFISPELVS